jgi:hippurate hydrolase
VACDPQTHLAADKRNKLLRNVSIRIIRRGAMSTAAARPGGSMTDNSLVTALAASAEPFRRLRRDIHANPELGFDVGRTAGLVAARLREWGYEVAAGVGGSGIVARLRNGGGNRSIGLRADMDALPIHEGTGLPWASRVEGRMHACGHDGHTAILLSAAEHLARTRSFNGTVNLIFQPDEENLCGAKAMMDDGLFDRFPCDAVFALHNGPGVPVGEAVAAPGTMMCACDRATVKIQGVGSHGAQPHRSHDPLVATAAIVMALQTVVSRNVNPDEFGVVTVGAMNAGATANVIPDTAALKIDVRYKTAEVGALIEQRVRAIVEGQAAAYGVSAEIAYERRVPVVVNHPEETRLAQDVLTELLGPEKVRTTSSARGAGSEDFAWMLQARPGCYVILGNGEGEWHGCHAHNPGYDFNDDCIPIGAAFWVRLVERFLA